MRSEIRRKTAWILAAVMLLTGCPAAAFAADTDTGAASESTAADTAADPGKTTVSESGSTAETTAPAELKKVSKPGKDAKVKKGWYYLMPACSSTRVASIASKSKTAGANLRLNKQKYASYQLFYIKPLGSGLYTIRNKNSKLYLEAEKEGTAKKTNVCQGNSTGRNAQKWYITKKNGKYVIQSAVSKNVLSVVSSKDKNKQNIYLYPWKKKKGQQWSLIKQAATASGKWKTSKRVWKGNAEDYKILANIIGAIESGDQIYANLNYGAYDPPYKNSPNEHTITLGWPQCYGPEAQELLKAIYNKDKKAFKKIDKVLPKNQRIQNYINKNITAMRWNPNKKQKKVIIKLLKSKAGKSCQDAQFRRYMKAFVKDCTNTYTKNAWAVVMYCQIRHLGGKNAATRIFNSCGGDYSLNKIMAVLKRDQSDPRSNYQVGDAIFQSRHNCVCNFLQTYMK